MQIEEILEGFKKYNKISSCFTAWEHIPTKDAIYEDFPDWIEGKLMSVLIEKGIEKLYSHQASALNSIREGKNVVVVTPTASGKTLCYNLPVLDAILKDENSRALYLFPTKALSQDQLKELYQLLTALDEGIKTYTYDGDTPNSARQAIRKQGHIVVTNPDMLHLGILPHHIKWLNFFQNLKYVIIDEIHIYRGVFGSHLGNVIRRLKRICRFYGSNPQFICCSATIANPRELSQKIVGENFDLVDNNGAPQGEKHFLFYNPPVINKELGIRKSVINEVAQMVSYFLDYNIQTIVFARSRLTTEVLTSYLKDFLAKTGRSKDIVRGYRGGYLPNLRREIERGLKDGEIKGVVSTNALELGIDIGQLDACIMAGYPGTISSTWQQAGRAGRRSNTSIAILVASSNPIDQFVINHSTYFFGESPESVVIDPNNLSILINHIRCASFELPFKEGEDFGTEKLEDILKHLEEKGVIRHVGGKWYWMSEIYPANEISLRSASLENFVIIDTSSGEQAQVIGEVDKASVPTLIYKGAIYLHEGVQYSIKKLDYEEQKAYAERVKVNYYTDAQVESHIEVLEELDKNEEKKAEYAYGEVNISTRSTTYKKVKFYTHENIGFGEISLPLEEMHTTAYWISLSGKVVESLKFHEDEEISFDLGSGLLALSNILINVAPLYIMCDPQDIRTVPEVCSPITGKPTIYIYDNYPGGVGFSEKMFHLHKSLLKAARELIVTCGCDKGCPSCVGPIDEVGVKGKDSALLLLEEVLS
ncbi:MAG: DEAD/DEAH box helicase [Candidatus Caldatribacteriota bacterium]|nr:DEAD/DEAH box helicase [Candidatus Caldatribacteriota bacterium]